MPGEVGGWVVDRPLRCAHNRVVIYTTLGIVGYLNFMEITLFCFNF